MLQLAKRRQKISLWTIAVMLIFSVFNTVAMAETLDDEDLESIRDNTTQFDRNSELICGGVGTIAGNVGENILSNAIVTNHFTEGELMTSPAPTAIVVHYTQGLYNPGTGETKADKIVEVLRDRTDATYPEGRRVQLFITNEGIVYQLTNSLVMKPIQTMNDDPTWNDVSIGIELEGVDEDDILDNTSQYQALLPVLRELMTKYNIPVESSLTSKTGIVGHYEVNSDNSDPGPDYLAKVKADLADFAPPVDSGTDYSAGTNCSCSTGVDFSGNNNVEVAYNYLVSKGLASFQAAGVVGNLYEESWGMNPNIEQGGATITSASQITPGTGYGIAQWTASERQDAWLAFAEDREQDALSLELQLEFLWHELETNTNYGKAELEASETIEDATWIFMAFFEVPRDVIDADKVRDLVIPTDPESKVFENYNNRLQNAIGTLSEYGGNVPGGSGGDCVLNTAIPDFSASGVRIDGSPPWENGANCAPGFTEGAAILRQFILDTWQPPVTSIGGYHCRHIVGDSSATSIHGMGRALDIMISALDPETLAVGDNIRNWLINNSPELGLQRVIWNRYTWSSQRDGWRDYCNGGCWDEVEDGGKSPHTDHLHIEINDDGANLLTPFYQGRS